MARRRRSFSQFSLSFLDAMACGLGAVILIFMIITHAIERHAVDTHQAVVAEVSQLEEQVLRKRETTAGMAQALQKTREQRQAASAEAAELKEIIEREDDSDKQAREQRERVAALKAELSSIQKQMQSLRERDDKGDAIRRIEGEGRRQYLTGLQMGGSRILILLDASSSMLAEQVVDVFRYRNMSEAEQRGAPKWRWALTIVDWITAQTPGDARFQIYTFNTDVEPALEGTADRWQDTQAGERLTEAVEALRQRVPRGGGSLEQAFMAAKRLSPAPDNIFLITDGLPTQDAGGGRRGMVSGRQRESLFQRALKHLPSGVPVNVLLLPLEGDPMASPLYWQLAQRSGGSFMSPSRDWP